MAEDPPDRLASQHALAGAYQANGRVKEAVNFQVRKSSLTKSGRRFAIARVDQDGQNGQVKVAWFEGGKNVFVSPFTVAKYEKTPQEPAPPTLGACASPSCQRREEGRHHQVERDDLLLLRRNMSFLQPSSSFASQADARSQAV